MSSMSDFIIEYGTLIQYVGPGGDVVIPEGVTEIGPEAFHNSMKTLTTISFPEGVIVIGDKAFKNCYNLISAVLPDSLRKIGKEAFDWCSSLKNISIPDNVSEIGDRAFNACSSLEEFVFPEAVTVISPSVLSNGKMLKSVVLPRNVTSISEVAFWGTRCDFTIHDWIPDMTKATKWCSPMVIHTEYLSKVPAKLRLGAAIGYCLEGGKNASAECAAEYEKYLTQHSLQMKNSAFDQPLVLQFLCEKKLIKAKDLDAYFEEAEKRGDAEKKALLLDYQNKLGEKNIAKAREKREKARKDYADELVNRISGRDLSKGIEGMTFVVTGKLSFVWDSRKDVQEYLASYGAKLGNSITKATDYLVTNDSDSNSEKNKRAQELGVPVISEEVFNEMIGKRFQDAELITIPEWLRSIEDSAFKGCHSLTAVRIPEGVQSIGESAFLNCSSLTTVSIPESVTSIGSYAFSNCKSLTRIIIPAGVQNLGSGIFSGCKDLEKISVAEGNAFFHFADGLLLTKDNSKVISCAGSLTSANIPNGVLSIGAGAFSGCKTLVGVTIPESVTSIGDSAFSGCEKLVSVTIPGSVQSIGLFAFSGCYSLKKVTIPASVQSIGYSAFNSLLLSIQAPKGSFAQKYAKKNKIQLCD